MKLFLRWAKIVVLFSKRITPETLFNKLFESHNIKKYNQRDLLFQQTKKVLLLENKFQICVNLNKITRTKEKS